MPSLSHDLASAEGTTGAAAATEVFYWIDRSDVIVRTAGAWDAFATANDAPGLAAGCVIGRNLFNFIHGDATRMYVRTLIQSARLLRKPVAWPYRCDSPGFKRYMEMQLFVEDNGLLRWTHRLLRTEALNPPRHFQAASGRQVSFVVRCSMCNQLKAEDGWREPEAMPVHRSEASVQGLPVIYGVCPSCLSAGWRGQQATAMG